MESSDPGEYSDYAQQPSEVSVELDNTETVTKLAEKALKDLKVATPEHSGSDEKHEKSEPSTTPIETVSSPVEVKNVAEPSQNPPETTKISVTVPSAPASVAPISSPVQSTKTVETGPNTPVTPKDNTVTAGSISEYSSPPEEVDVERNNTETPPVLSTKSSSSGLNPPPTAISTSKETVISYGKITDTNVLTAVSPSTDLKTAKGIGLLTFTELNKTEESSPRTAKPSLICIKTNEPIYANITQKAPPVLPTKSSPSDLNPPPTAISTSKETVISYGKITDTNVLTVVSPSADLKTAKGIGLLTFTELNKTEEGSLRTTKPSVTCVKTNEPIYANITQKVSVSALSSPSVSSSNLSVYTPSPSELDCEITDTEGVMQESQKKN